MITPPDSSSQCCGSMVKIRIRIRGSIPLTNGLGCGSGSSYFHYWPSRRQQKTNLKKMFLAYYFLKVHLYPFSKIKSQKEVKNSRNQGFSYYFWLMIEGSGSFRHKYGSGSRRPKNTWIRIRIRNTGSSDRILENLVSNLSVWRTSVCVILCWLGLKTATAALAP